MVNPVSWSFLGGCTESMLAGCRLQCWCRTWAMELQPGTLSWHSIRGSAVAQQIPAHAMCREAGGHSITRSHACAWQLEWVRGSNTLQVRSWLAGGPADHALLGAEHAWLRITQPALPLGLHP